MEEYRGLLNSLYNELFNRNVADPGLQYWGNLLATGLITEDQLRNALISAAQGADLDYYNQYVANQSSQPVVGGGGVESVVGGGGVGYPASTTSTDIQTNVGPGAQSPTYTPTVSNTGDFSGIQSQRNTTNYDYSSPISNTYSNAYDYSQSFVDPRYSAYNTYMYDTAPLMAMLSNLGYLSPTGQGNQLSEYGGGPIQDPQVNFTPMTAKGGDMNRPANPTYGKGGKGGYL